MGVTAFKLGCKLEAASRTQSSLVGGLRNLHMNFIGGLRVGLGKAQRDANSLAQIASLSPSNKKSLEARRFTKPADLRLRFVEPRRIICHYSPSEATLRLQSVVMQLTALPVSCPSSLSHNTVT